MSHKKEWKVIISRAKEYPNILMSGTIIAADRIVRAARAVDQSRMTGGGSLTSKLDTLHRAVENFEKEGKG